MTIFIAHWRQALAIGGLLGLIDAWTPYVNGLKVVLP